MANAPLILTRAEFRGWFENFNSFVYDEAYVKLEYDKWNTLNIWSRKDSDWLEIAIDWTADGDVIWIYPRDEIRLSPNSVIVSANDLSFGRFLWDAMMDYYDNLEISLKAVGNSAKAAAETIANATLDWDKFSHLTHVADDISVCTNFASGDIYIDDTCLSDYIKNVVEEVNNNNKENNEMMKFDFGPVDSSIHMSMYGMAIKNASGTYVAYDVKTNSIMDVDIINFEGANKFMYKMPVALNAVREGDIIVHARKPHFVTDVASEENRMIVIDIFDGEEKVIVPTQSPFGFSFVTKVVSLIDFANGADASNPFGNMLPFLLMSDSKSNDNTMLMAMAMMGGHTDMMQNPLMLYALMNKDGKNNDMLPFLLMGGFGANPNGSNGK